MKIRPLGSVGSRSAQSMSNFSCGLAFLAISAVSLSCSTFQACPIETSNKIAAQMKEPLISQASPNLNAIPAKPTMVNMAQLKEDHQCLSTSQAYCLIQPMPQMVAPLERYR